MANPENLRTAHLQGHHGKKGGHPGRGNTKFDKQVKKTMDERLERFRKNMTKAGLTRRFVLEADARNAPEIIMDTMMEVLISSKKEENKMKAAEIIGKWTMVPTQEVVLEENDSDTKAVLKQLAEVINSSD